MATTQDNYFMQLAIKKARQGILQGQTPFGCCIIKNKKIIALAHNQVWKTTDSTAHAEIIALRQACKKLKTVDLSGCTLYGTCEPCPMCFAASHWAKISKIVYGAAIADAKKAGFNELTIAAATMKKLGKSKVVVEANVSAKECTALFKFWKKKGLSVEY